MEEVITTFDSGYCKTKKKAKSSLDLNKIYDILDEKNMIRDIGWEIDDLIDYVECITLKKGEASNDLIRVIRNEKGWRIIVNV